VSDWSFAELDEAVRRTLRVLDRYVKQSREGRDPVVPLPPVSEIIDELGLKRWVKSGSMDSETFESFLVRYLARSTRMHHPAYMAHQVAVPDSPAALADLVHGVINNPMAIYEMGPSAVAVELVVIDWMLDKVGWISPKGSGVLTHGGSLANLTALLAARAQADPEAWDSGTSGILAVLAPPSSHYSVRRAASILGIGNNNVIPVEVDANEVILPSRLSATVRQARDNGKQVMALVANACATSTGLHDPLDELGSFCREEGLWLHVDGAHGASALVSEKERTLLNGVEKADSLTWDAHKMLRTSGLCTAVLFREAHALDRAFQQKASYLFYDDEKPGVDLIDRTVECTKTALGLKVFLNLAWRGENGLAHYVEDRYELTRRLYKQIDSRKDFECPYPPEANILCFRYRDDDELQVAIRDRLLEEGRFHISSTEIHGRRYLRLTVISPQTTEKTIDGLLDAIERTANEIGSQ
jgi:L-2,4-diaminobutyrate decarboxylase